jgi:hypothetical protein
MELAQMRYFWIYAIVGILTASSLNAENAKKLEFCNRSISTQLDENTFKFELQVQLKLAGYYQGKIDGIIGPISCDALDKSLTNARAGDTKSLNGDGFLEALPRFTIVKKDKLANSVTMDDIIRLPGRFEAMESSIQHLKKSNEYLLKYVKYLRSKIEKK